MRTLGKTENVGLYQKTAKHHKRVGEYAVTVPVTAEPLHTAKRHKKGQVNVIAYTEWGVKPLEHVAAIYSVATQTTPSS